ncbi:hypothetical protein GE061_012699 [Apolygus lucorum]|uniref:Uncharacterized protein n=1 Tax=Apolygus lucorum TaxID=248454 RepID=A0A6A4JCH5_APOLU|nr:hypothetical protein GE061_012699 [Apolygus lucorum]
MRRRKYLLTILSGLIVALEIFPSSTSSIYQLTMKRPNPKNMNQLRLPASNDGFPKGFPKEIRNEISPHKVSDSDESPNVSSENPKVANDSNTKGSSNTKLVPDCYTYRYQVSDEESGVYRDHSEFRNSGGMIHGELSIVRDEVKIDIKYKGLPSKGWEASVEQAPGLPLLAPMAPALPLTDKANHGLRGPVSQGMFPSGQASQKWPFLKLADRRLPSFGLTNPRFPQDLARSQQLHKQDSRCPCLLAKTRCEVHNQENVPHHKPLHSYRDLNEVEERLRLFYHNNHVHVDKQISNG